MILFFDRSLGRGIPRALKRLKKFPAQVEMHDSHFSNLTHDDVWLEKVGQWGWVVIGQDYSHHLMANELFAIKTYNVGVFYLWGASALQWDQFRVMARAWDKIVAASTTTAPPFVFRITKDARLLRVKLP